MEDIVIDESEKNIKQLLLHCRVLIIVKLELIEMRYFEKRFYREIGEILDIMRIMQRLKHSEH